MDSRKQRKILLINMVLAAIIISTALFVFESMGAPADNYKEVEKGIELLGNVYNLVYNNYVKDINAWNLSKDGVAGILKNLDPYSTFFEKTDYRQIREDSRGEFAGLGIMIGTYNDYPTVMETPIEGSPAMKVGLRAGDMIVEIEGESTYKVPLNTVVGKLRGKINTIVNIKIQRGKRDELLAFSIKRDRIPLENISYSGEIEDGIGYLRLIRFNAEAPGEMKEDLN